MKIYSWIVFHAAVLVFAGLIFLLYSPLVIAWLRLNLLVQDPQGYWAMVSFARLFGMALLAWGGMTLMACQIIAQTAAAEPDLRKILLILVVGDFLGAFSAAIQAASVWGALTSWSISLGFAVLGVLSLSFLLFTKRDAR